MDTIITARRDGIKAGIRASAVVLMLSAAGTLVALPACAQTTQAPSMAAPAAGVDQPIMDSGLRSEDPQGTPKGAGMQAASFLLTIPYGVAKSVFALSGGIVGGLTYVFTGLDTEAAKKVWHTSMYGTYVLTPEHLRGEKPVRFLGVPDEASSAATPAFEPSAAIDTAPASEPVR